MKLAKRWGYSIPEKAFKCLVDKSFIASNVHVRVWVKDSEREQQLDIKATPETEIVIPIEANPGEWVMSEYSVDGKVFDTAGCIVVHHNCPQCGCDLFAST